MCRLAAYLGPQIPLQNIISRPSHSLLRQSHSANEAKLQVNGDGFGISWYGADDTPGQYRDVLPAWSDSNLLSICRLVQSPLFLAHVRASTTGETSRANCHPFVQGAWSFMHNGQIPHIDNIRRHLEAQLPEELYLARQGTTDSELIFLLLLAQLKNLNPKQACEQVIQSAYQQYDPGDPAIRLSCVFTDGETLYAFRHSSDANSPTLYYSEKLDSGGQAFASEPLDGCADNWQLIPENSFCVLTEQQVEISALVPMVSSESTLYSQSSA